MAAMRPLAMLAGLMCGLTAPHAAAQQLPSSPFCVVPVQGGTPTGKDVNEAWRMVFKVITLPGVPRPVIYALNRGGVWTIDETRAFVPFGGEFPSSFLRDHIARDPDTGRSVGVNDALGVFALDPGETQFRKLHAVSPTSLRHPYSIEFIPRFRGFVINDANGLFLLDRDGALTPLPINNRAVLHNQFKSFDLPAFNALVINAQDSQAVVRFDDGEVVRVATFDRYDYVRGVTVEPNGTLSLRGGKKTQNVHLSRPPMEPIVQGRSFVIGEAKLRSSRARLEALSIGKTIVMHATTGLSELTPDGTVPLALPFDPAKEPIDSLMEIPQYKAVLIFTKASAYALQPEGAVTEILGAREAGISRLGAPVAVIPGSNETIFLGRNTLNLLLDSRISGGATCRASAQSKPP